MQRNGGKASRTTDGKELGRKKDDAVQQQLPLALAGGYDVERLA